MNIKEFIETSGLVEAYVTGTLSEQEARGVECLAKTYPEIKQEIDVYNQTLGKYTRLYEKQPPAGLKEQIFAQMHFAPENEQETSLSEESEEPVAETKVIPMWSKLALAASVALAAGTFWLISENNKLKENSAGMEARLSILENEQNKQQELLSSFENPNVQIVKLNGVEAHPEGSVIIHWNREDNSVALQVNDLPKPAAGKQYQLWIIGENGPEDMGMVDNNFKDKILAMKSVNGKPSAFAITLENEGGVSSPTLEQLYVIGNV